MGVEHLGAADEDAGFAAAGFAYPVGIPTYAMSASSRPPGRHILGGAAGLGIQRGGKAPSDRCAAPVVGIVPHGWAATLRTILPWRFRLRLRSNAARASRNGKIWSTGTRSSPVAASLPSSISCWRFGSTMK